MNINNKINSMISKMTKSEIKIATYFLENTDSFAFETLDEIAEKIGTSTTSVIRFCRKLGFLGYKEFQNEVRTVVKSNLSLPAKLERIADDSPDNLKHFQIVKNVISCIDKTFQNISSDLIYAASNTISEAKRVFCFGLKESFALSHYAYTRFLTMRSNVFILSAGQGGEIESVLSLKKGDVCIFFLFHRYTNPAPQILELLKSRGVTVILITSLPCDSVQDNADILLLCDVDINGIKNSAASPICLVDCLCNQIASFDNKTLDYLKESEELFKRFTF